MDTEINRLLFQLDVEITNEDGFLKMHKIDILKDTVHNVWYFCWQNYGCTDIINLESLDDELFEIRYNLDNGYIINNEKQIKEQFKEFFDKVIAKDLKNKPLIHKPMGILGEIRIDQQTVDYFHNSDKINSQLYVPYFRELNREYKNMLDFLSEKVEEDHNFVMKMANARDDYIQRRNEEEGL